MPSLSTDEISRFRDIFNNESPQNGYLSGDKMVRLLSNSQLGNDVLQKIWQLADIDSDGAMDFDEFCVAMRLVFDVKFNKIPGVPDQLPDWLVPQSKRHLVLANSAVGGTLSNSINLLDDDDEEMKLRGDFNWYVNPEERSTYESMYSVNADPRGKVSFESLNDLYETLNVPRTDISSAWNLVNPRSDEKIDKEQFIVFMHILNQRSNGVRIPRSVPASLRATFSKQTPSYDLNSDQAKLTPLVPTKSGSKGGFAEAYMNRLKMNQKPYSSSQGTDFGASKDADWEESRLKRELADLEQLIEKVEREKKESKHKSSASSSMVRRELQLLLEYKERQLKASKNAPKGDANSLAETQQEVDMINEQVSALRDHLDSRKDQLRNLRQEIDSL